MTRRWAAALLTLPLLATACGGSHGGGEAAAAASPSTTSVPSASTTAAPAATTTTTEPLPPGGRRPTADDPLRVLLAGDSLMADMSLAVSSTLQDGGNAVVRLVASPSVPRLEVYRALWREQLDGFDPDVIVVLVGVWEGMAEDALSTAPLGSPEWERAYVDQTLRPYLRLLTREGARVVWVGMPPGHDADRELEYHSINRAVADLAQEARGLTFIPGGRLLAAPGGGWADILPGPNGNPQRVRRLDTTHLCAAGAERLARPVLRWIRHEYDVPLAPDWSNRNWRWVFPPDECPAP